MKRLLLYLMGFGVMICGIYQKHDELISIAVVLAYMAGFSLLLAPLCAKLEKRGFSSAAAAGSAVFAFFLMVFLAIAAFIPYLVFQTDNLLERIEPVASELLASFLAWNNDTRLGVGALADSGNVIRISLGSITGWLVRTGVAAMTQIGRIAFSLVLTYYVLCDRKRFAGHLMLLVPSNWRKQVMSMLHICRNAMLGYYAGLLKTSAFVAAATLIGLILLGIEDALLLALVMGAFEILPYLGPVFAAVPILLSALMKGTGIALMTLVLLIAVQIIEGNLIGPYFTASSTSVHPFAAILSVFVMGNLFGIWGIMLAVPTVISLQMILLSVRRGISESG